MEYLWFGFALVVVAIIGVKQWVFRRLDRLERRIDKRLAQIEQDLARDRQAKQPERISEEGRGQ